MAAIIRIKDIHEADHGALATIAIAQTLDRLGKRVFTKSDLLRLISEHREKWHILAGISPKKIIDYLLTAFQLRKITLEGDTHSQEFSRYLWREASPLEVAASIRAPRSYLSHSSALFIHELIDDLPKDICINYEQSQKPRPIGGLTQESITSAFEGKPRQTGFIFRHPKHRIIVLNGKQSGNLGVEEIAIDTGAKLRVTNIERTLIDVTVRPIYAGGVERVLEAYRRAQSEVSIPKLIDTLGKLDYLYPFHQAIGFYLERSGYHASQLHEFEKPKMDFDFYLTHGIRNPAYSKRWRLFYPPRL